MLEMIPYWHRVGLLLLTLWLVASIDWYRHRENATRPKEYAFLVLAGVVGGIFGFGNDLVTCWISPDYFAVGKGLAPGDGLIWRAGLLGIKAGFSAGAVAGAVCLYASSRPCRCPPLACRSLLGFLWRPLIVAPITAMVLAVLFHRLDPLGLSAELDGILNARQTHRFLVVWWVHAGAYLGLLASLAWIVSDILRLRKEQARLQPPAR